MTFKEAIPFLKPQLNAYLEKTDRAIPEGRAGVCPVCDKGHNTGCASLFADGQKVHCFSTCNRTYDIFDIVGHDFSIVHFEDQVRKAAGIMGVEIEGEFESTKAYANRDALNASTTMIPPAAVAHAKAISFAELSESPKFKEKYAPYLAERKKSFDYLAGRGIPAAVSEAHAVGYYSKHDLLIIPVTIDYFVARALDRKEFWNPPDVKVALLGLEVLDQFERPVVIVESAIDMMSIETAGGLAISLNSANNVDLFVAEARARKHLPPLILALDNDEAGIKAQKDLAFKLDRLGFFTWDSSRIFGVFKDANEHLMMNPTEFFKSVESAQQEVWTRLTAELEKKETAREEYRATNSMILYLLAFPDHILESASRPPIPTGFTYLDRVLDGGLFEGLYIIGAITSLGKTTFVMQIADFIAAAGWDVIFVSLEMSRREMLAKSLSRTTFMLDDDQRKLLSKTTRGIMNGVQYCLYRQEELDHIDKAAEDYFTPAANFFLVEGNGDVGPASIANLVAEHIRITGKRPVVVVDYLQILAPTDIRATDKQNTDAAVTALKRLSRNFKIPVIAVSSLNRDNYSAPINLQAFKESGAIEYSSDVLIGLQVRGADQFKTSDGQRGDNTKAIEQGKQKEPREIELKILKNRNGRVGDVLAYRYYAKFNFFDEQKPAMHGGR